jgi:hypothetical protein
VVRPGQPRAGTLQWLDTNGLNITQLQEDGHISGGSDPAAALLLTCPRRELPKSSQGLLCRAAAKRLHPHRSRSELSADPSGDFDGFDFNALTSALAAVARLQRAANTLPRLAPPCWTCSAGVPI